TVLVADQRQLVLDQRMLHDRDAFHQHLPGYPSPLCGEGGARPVSGLPEIGICVRKSATHVRTMLPVLSGLRWSIGAISAADRSHWQGTFVGRRVNLTRSGGHLPAD